MIGAELVLDDLDRSVGQLPRIDQSLVRLLELHRGAVGVAVEASRLWLDVSAVGTLSGENGVVSRTVRDRENTELVGGRCRLCGCVRFPACDHRFDSLLGGRRGVRRAPNVRNDLCSGRS